MCVFFPFSLQTSSCSELSLTAPGVKAPLKGPVTDFTDLFAWISRKHIRISSKLGTDDKTTRPFSLWGRLVECEVSLGKWQSHPFSLSLFCTQVFLFNVTFGCCRYFTSIPPLTCSWPLNIYLLLLLIFLKEAFFEGLGEVTEKQC